MHRSNRWADLNIVQLISDIAFLFGSFILAYFISNKLTRLVSINSYLWIGLLYSITWTYGMSVMKMYDLTTFSYNDRILRNICKASIISSAFIIAMIFLLKQTYYSRIFMVIYIATSVLILLAQRYLFKYLPKTFHLHDQNLNRKIIVGSEEHAEKYLNYLKKTSSRYKIVGYVQLDDGKDPPDHCLGKINDLERILKEYIIDEVIFSIPTDYIGKIEDFLLLCEKMGITAKLLSNMYNFKNSRYHISMLGPIPLITFYTVSLNPIQKLLKRTMDIVGSIVGLILTGIISFFLIPVIKLDSPGPVLFKQTRVGLNGREFKIYKFRTMYVDSELRKKELLKKNDHEDGRIFKIKSDPRITRPGAVIRKLSLDELPQFINVLRGDMSLVGTRPPLIEEVNQYEIKDYRRLSIKPGITGMWQISGRSSIRNFDDIVKLDAQYIDNWTLGLDVMIILKTAFKIFADNSAY